MGPNPCIESGPRRKGVLSSENRQRIAFPGYSAIAAIMLLSGTAARAQTPPGQQAIVQQAAIAPIIQTLLGSTPATLPGVMTFLDGTGSIETYVPGGAVTTGGSPPNPFFDTSLTSNGRSCFTCHLPQGGWTTSPPQVTTIYASSAGKSPMFQPIDSANCPDAPGAVGPAGPKFVAARSMLFNHGNFRIAINAPNPLDPDVSTFEGNTPSDPGDNEAVSPPQWVMTVLKDPTGCENDPKYGLPAGTASVYRRTMPSANIAFLDPGGRASTTPQNGPLFNIMWDAREPTLESQFVDATEFHGQTTNEPSSADQEAGALFQQGVFAAQNLDFTAGDLTGADGSGALGGPENLFESRLNVPAGGFGSGCFAPEEIDIDGTVDFCPGMFGIPNVFDLYGSFADATSKVAGEAAKRQSIARGEVIFNTRTFVINDVPGLNDVAAGPCSNPAPGNCKEGSGTCSFCHNNLNVANDNFLDPKRTGIMDNSNNTNNALPYNSDYPEFAFFCPSGSMHFFSNPVTSPYCQDLPGSPTTCDEYITTDPGEGLADGECNDLGKMKVPPLHSLAARAPYFHGGNSATLLDVVNFYNTRFSIGLSSQDKTDLVNFLNTL